MTTTYVHTILQGCMHIFFFIFLVGNVLGLNGTINNFSVNSETATSSQPSWLTKLFSVTLFGNIRIKIRDYKLDFLHIFDISHTTL